MVASLSSIVAGYVAQAEVVAAAAGGAVWPARLCVQLQPMTDRAADGQAYQMRRHRRVPGDQAGFSLPVGLLHSGAPTGDLGAAGRCQA